MLSSSLWLVGTKGKVELVRCFLLNSQVLVCCHSAAVSKKKDAAKPAAMPKKAPVKPLPEMMQEEIIPPLKVALEAEEDVSQVQLAFQNSTVSADYYLGPVWWIGFQSMSLIFLSPSISTRLSKGAHRFQAWAGNCPGLMPITYARSTGTVYELLKHCN
jgi:hypothetical protein